MISKSLFLLLLPIPLLCGNVPEPCSQGMLSQLHLNTRFPQERGFITEMSMEDTVTIFYKQSGWTNSAHLSSRSFYTFYSRKEITRIGYRQFSEKITFCYTAPNRFKPFEFDTMKYRLDELYNLTSIFELYCPITNDFPTENELTNCCWDEDFTIHHPDAFENYQLHELTSEKYQSWRYYRPSYYDLENWRKADYQRSIWKTEMLVFWRDTCKISYTDELNFLPGQVYDY
jgi:hypothetical protein